MKRLLLGTFIACLAAPAVAQITITAANMPVAGDSLIYSIANPGTTVNYASTGANYNWDFSALTPIAQGADAYKFAMQVNATYGGTISATAYGYKIADSLPGAPLPITELYNFFNKKPAGAPTRFVIEGFAAKIATTPTPINYSDEDEVYFFPLSYPHTTDNSTFRLSYSVPFVGSFSQQGSRTTDVDGYGTIKTPYTSSPVQVIRVRSEITEVDSFTFGGTSQAISRNTIEYKWLSTTERYPMLIITTNKMGTTETVTGVRYRDTYRALGISNASAPMSFLSVFPNPAPNNITVQVPPSWKSFYTSVYDATGKIVCSARDMSQIHVEMLPAGTYLITVESSGNVGVAHFVK